ncbi:hypothetical protein LINPERHAP1_LOCUS9806, partial [Linum perenne]
MDVDRLFTTWDCSIFHELNCSPNKIVSWKPAVWPSSSTCLANSSKTSTISVNPNTKLAIPSASASLPPE